MSLRANPAPILFFIIATLALIFLRPTQFGDFGTNDFVEYWSAYRAVLAGQDPYNPAVLLPIQQSIGRAHPEPLMMWNPPWTLILFAPILHFDFFTAALLWSIASIAALIVSACLLTPKEISQRLLFFVLLLSVVFYPTLLTLQVGQISLFLLLATAMFVRGVKDNKIWLICLGTLGITLKPHLFYLVLLAFAWWIVRKQQWKIASLCTLTILAVSCLCMLVNEELLRWWIRGTDTSTRSVEIVHILSWNTPTLVGFLRGAFAGDADFVLWPVIIIPILSAISLLALLIFTRFKNNFHEKICYIIALSILTTPFAWLFDLVILLPLFLQLLPPTAQQTYHPSSRLVLGIFGFLIVQAIPHALIYLGVTEHDDYAWYPMMQVAMFYYMRLNTTRFL